MNEEALARAHVRKSARLRRWAAWGAIHGPGWFVRGAPPIIGFFFALFSADARARVVRNLRRIHGRRPLFEEARDVVATFVHFARALTRSLAPERPSSVAKSFKIRGGRQEVLNILQSGRGLIMLTAHVGPWDTAAIAFRLDVPIMMLMSPEEDQGAADFQDALRASVDIQVLRLGGGSLAALPLLEHLRKGGAVVSQMDRVPVGQEAIWVELFGKPFAVPKGLFRLASAARVPIVPVFCARLSGDRAVADVGAPIEVPRRASGDVLRERAQAVATLLERHLAAFPTQWFHFSDEPQPE